MSSSDRDLMLQARDLIKEGRYAEARAILLTIDHPQAARWIEQIDARDPTAAARAEALLAEAEAEEYAAEPEPTLDRAAIARLMQQARELVRDGRYEVARALLETIPHPKAREWLTQLDELQARTAPQPSAPARPGPQAPPAPPGDPVQLGEGQPYVPPGQDTAAKQTPPALTIGAFALTLLGAVAALVIALLLFLISIELMGEEEPDFDQLINAGFAINGVVAGLQAYWALTVWEQRPGAARTVSRYLLWGIGPVLAANALLLAYVGSADKFDANTAAGNLAFLVAALGGWLACTAIAGVLLRTVAAQTARAVYAVDPFAVDSEPLSPAIKPYQGERLLAHLTALIQTGDGLIKAANTDLLITNYRLVVWLHSRNSSVQPSSVFERLVRRLGLMTYRWVYDGSGTPHHRAHLVRPGYLAIPYRALEEATSAPDPGSQLVVAFKNQRGQSTRLLIALNEEDADLGAELVAALDGLRKGRVPERGAGLSP